MKNQRLLSLLLGLSVALSGCSGSKSRLKNVNVAEGEIVEAEGSVAYREDDLPGTKAAALAAAQRAAVELVVGVYVNANTRVEKSVAIENGILSQTSGYVKKYEILSEGRSGDLYKTRIRALVLTGAVHEKLDRLGLLRKQSIGHPRTAVLLQEFVKEREDSNGYAARSLTQALLNQGFKVVDLPQSVNRGDDPIEIARGLNRSAAEIVLIGVGQAQSLGYGKQFGGMASYRASVSFRALETGTGEVLATVSQTASGLEATQNLAAQKALEKAAELAGKELSTLPDELAKRAHTDLTIVGIHSFEKLSKFKDDLGKQPAVKDVYLRSFNQESGVAVMDVLMVDISPQDLADRAARLGGPDWSVYQVSGRSVQLSATQAGR